MTTYRIGPNQPDASLPEQFNWAVLVPGDVVQIYGRSVAEGGPYKSKIQLARSGSGNSDSQRIRVLGVPGTGGAMPVLDANGAVEWAGSVYPNEAYAYQGPITVIPRGDEGGGYKVKYVTIDGFEIMNCTGRNKFTRWNGNVVNWNFSQSCAVASWMSENLTLRNINTHHNTTGIFVNSPYYGEQDLIRNLLFEYCYCHDNGLPNADHYHDMYVEGDSTVVQFCRFGPNTAGSTGSGEKDRSGGLISRYNYFDHNSGWPIDMCCPYDAAGYMQIQSDWGKQQVYGNIIINRSPLYNVQIGGDQVANTYEQPLLNIWNNTIISYYDGTGGTSRIFFKIKSGIGTRVHAANNLFMSYGNPPGGMWVGQGEWGCTYVDLERNWWYNTTNPNNTGNTACPNQYDPTVSNWANQLLGSDPGFKDATNADWRLVSGSPCVNTAGSLPATWMQPAYQYDPTNSNPNPTTGQTWIPRTSWNNIGGIETVA